LHFLAYLDDAEALSHALDEGVSYLTDINGMTPLTYAMKNQNYESMNVIFKHFRKHSQMCTTYKDFLKQICMSSEFM
jgi:ankyrin repeat protein